MDTVNPGSQEAVEQGCLCPVFDNNKGKGTSEGFWINGSCPLHGLPPQHVNTDKE